MTKISFDAGHGYKTTGKRVPDGSMREWEFNDAVVKLCMTSLSKYKAMNLLRVDDPTGRVDVPLKDRTDRINSWNSDAHVSVHANGFGLSGWNSVRGIETYVYTSKPKGSLSLATKVQANLIKETGGKDRSVKAANFHMLRESHMTAILVECGFMTNRDDAALLKSHAYRIKCAKAIVDGLVSEYGLTPIPVPKKKVAPSGTFYRVVTGSFNDQANAEARMAELERKGFASFLDVYKK